MLDEKDNGYMLIKSFKITVVKVKGRYEKEV